MLKPIRDRILVECDDGGEKTAGGIVLTQVSRDPQRRAKVLAAGEGAWRKDGSFSPVTVRPGDIVEFAPGAGMEFDWEGKKYLMLNIQEVLGIVEA